jgi:hypothetical protein
MPRGVWKDHAENPAYCGCGTASAPGPAGSRRRIVGARCYLLGGASANWGTRSVIRSQLAFESTKI